MKKYTTFSLVNLILGYIFLYLPIAFVVIYSFNASRFSVWQGFSLRWYKELISNEALMNAVLASFKIASISATVAVCLGTLAALVIVRFGAFYGRTLFSGLVSAPLVMPDVITGLSLLMMFVTFERLIGWPSERGIMTVTLAHITLSLAYVYLIVQSRLQDFDISLEEAAQDLGARPFKVFFVITLPLIAPSLFSSWLLAFALSLDDVVIASFLSGPGATTLPMLIFSSVRLGVTPEINALATIIVGLVALVVTFTGFMLYKKQRTP
ncbi:MAG TPA: ABC transporter permease subunit [Alphaproteobacteria bacterium]|nr:ABC transporter permease subunit [Alphaproteobacteria bacterium]